MATGLIHSGTSCPRLPWFLCFALCPFAVCCLGMWGTARAVLVHGDAWEQLYLQCRHLQLQCLLPSIELLKKGNGCELEGSRQQAKSPG